MKKLRQSGFESLWRIFWQDHLALEGEGPFPENCGAVWDIEIEELLGRVGPVISAARADPQGDDTACGCPCDNVKGGIKTPAEAIFYLNENYGWNDPANPTTINGKNLYGGHGATLNINGTAQRCGALADDARGKVSTIYLDHRFCAAIT